MTALRTLLGLYGRFPRTFSVGFPVLLGILTYLVGHLMTLAQFERIEASVLSYRPEMGGVLAAIPLPLKVLGEGLLFLVLMVGAVMLAYDISVRLTLLLTHKAPFPVVAEELDEPGPVAEDGPLAGLRIGLVLAGGGAKGIYQAGALKAVHEFLERHGALGQVKAVAGTSIGSWNSLWWAAGLLGSADGQPSPHERWWKTTPMSRVVTPATYTPLQNYIFDNTAWRQEFDAIFQDNPEVMARLAALSEEDPGLHLYLTRSCVAEARLGFTTNRPRPHGDPQGWKDGLSLAGRSGPRAVAGWKEAVYASMDLPPAFAFSTIDEIPGEVFEDGGVVDNLPTRFAVEYEDCDLLFVFPLNATFEQQPSRHSIALRLMRVLDVRQGELERRSIRLLEHRNLLRTAQGKRPLGIFAVCPDHPLKVGTLDFGTADVPGCFDTMYEATKHLLEKELTRCLRGEELRLFRVGNEPDQITTEVLAGGDLDPDYTEIELGTSVGRKNS